MALLVCLARLEPQRLGVTRVQCERAVDSAARGPGERASGERREHIRVIRPRLGSHALQRHDLRQGIACGTVVVLCAAQVGEREPRRHVTWVCLDPLLELRDRGCGASRRSGELGGGAAGLGGRRCGHQRPRAHLSHNPRSGVGGPGPCAAGIVRASEEVVRLGEECPVIRRAAIARQARLERGDFRFHRLRGGIRFRGCAGGGLATRCHHGRGSRPAAK